MARCTVLTYCFLVDDDVVVVSSPGLPPPAVAPPVGVAAPPPGDGSYSFTYASEESYRTETSDPAGNVVGEYQYWAGGETPFAVKYAAGPDRGFVVLNQDEVDQNLVRISQLAPQPLLINGYGISRITVFIGMRAQ